jgi:hypothetical protein
MQEYQPGDGWQEPEEATQDKLADALKRGSDVAIYPIENRKARRAADARYRRSMKKKRRRR